jgi:hypothetical protein
MGNSLTKRFPDIPAEIDVPATEQGLWILDVRWESHFKLSSSGGPPSDLVSPRYWATTL